MPRQTAVNVVAAVLAASAIVAGLIGCGSGRRTIYRAGGKVVFTDGSPVPNGKIELAPIDQSIDALPKRPPNPIGVIANDGTFRLTTYEPFDGAFPGRYRAIVLPLQYETKPGQQPPKPAIHPKYSRFDTSNLEVEIQPQTNDLTIVIER